MWKEVGVCAFVACNLVGSASYADQILFNANGEQIILNADGTWENYGVPSHENGLIIYAQRMSEGVGENKNLTRDNNCEVSIAVENKTPYNLKPGLSALIELVGSAMYRDVGSKPSGAIASGATGEIIVGLPGRCSHYENNRMAAALHIDETSWEDVLPANVGTKDILKYLSVSNEGVWDMTNGKTLEELMIEDADTGNPILQYKLASMYYDGDRVAQDYDLAYYWFTHAAEKNHVEAQAKLASMYKKGLGTEKNNDKSIFWYLKAAESNNLDAQRELAEMYYFGDGVEKNYAKASYYFQQAAGRGGPLSGMALSEFSIEW